MKPDGDTVEFGCGFTVLLLTVFVTLKIAHVVTWSWWFVLLGPLAINMAIAASIALVTILLMLMIHLIGKASL